MGTTAKKKCRRERTACLIAAIAMIVWSGTESEIPSLQDDKPRVPDEIGKGGCYARLDGVQLPTPAPLTCTDDAAEVVSKKSSILHKLNETKTAICRKMAALSLYIYILRRNMDVKRIRPRWKRYCDTVSNLMRLH